MTRKLREVIAGLLGLFIVIGGLVASTTPSQATTTPAVVVSTALLPSTGLNPAANGPLIISSTACPTASWCTAVGQYPSASGPQLFEGILQHGSWTLHNVSVSSLTPAATGFGIQYGSEYAFLHMSCASTSYCLATGTYDSSGAFLAFNLIYDNGNWTVENIPSTIIAGVSSVPTGVSCTAPGVCVASGIAVDLGSSSAQNYVATLASGVWTITPVGSSFPTTGPGSGLIEFIALASTNTISCSSSTSCTFAGLGVSGGFVSTLANGVWNTTQLPLVGSSTVVLVPVGISCPSSNSCTAVGWIFDNTFNPSGGFTSTLANGAWTTTAFATAGITGNQGIPLAIACPAVGSCVIAGQSYGSSVSQVFVSSLANGVWLNHMVPTTNLPSTATAMWPVSVSCPVAQHCVVASSAVDSSSAVVGSFLASVDTAPPSPSNVRAVPKVHAAKVSWTGSQVATQYVATASPGGAHCTTTSTSCVISGLKSGQTYSVSVTASNAVGTSASSTVAMVTPSVAPTTTTTSSELPKTGSSSATLVMLSGFLIALGATSLLTLNKRRCRATLAKHS